MRSREHAVGLVLDGDSGLGFSVGFAGRNLMRFHRVRADSVPNPPRPLSQCQVPTPDVDDLFMVQRGTDAGGNGFAAPPVRGHRLGAGRALGSHTDPSPRSRSHASRTRARHDARTGTRARPRVATLNERTRRASKGVTVTELLSAVVALFLAFPWLASKLLALAAPYHRPLPLSVARVVGCGVGCVLALGLSWLRETTV